jgi:hypothetical protein
MGILYRRSGDVNGHQGADCRGRRGIYGEILSHSGNWPLDQTIGQIGAQTELGK